MCVHVCCVCLLRPEANIKCLPQLCCALFWKFILFYMLVWVALCIYVHHFHAWNLQKAEVDRQEPGNFPVCWESQSGPLPEQSMLLAISHLSSPRFSSFIFGYLLIWCIISLTYIARWISYIIVFSCVHIHSLCPSIHLSTCLSSIAVYIEINTFVT